MWVRQNSSREVIWAMDMEVLCVSVVSCCSLCLTIWIAGCTGTDVKRALTSYEVMIFPASNFLPWSCCMKCWVFLRWCGDWPTRGLMMCESSLATPYVMDPLLDTMGQRVVPVLCYFG